MARHVAYVQSLNTGAVAPLALDDIPKDIRDEVEEMYAGLKANPAGRFRATFDTVEEMAIYTRHVTSYCTVRPNGAIRFRKSPSKGLPENVMDFKITDLQTANEVVTTDIRTAAAAAGGTPVVAPTPTVGRKR